MASTLRIFTIAELAHLISEYLDQDDLAQLCLISKNLRVAFHSLLWRPYDFQEDESPTKALYSNMMHLRSLNLYAYPLNPRPFNIFERCNSVVQLHISTEDFDDTLDGMYGCFDDLAKKKLMPMLSTFHRNPLRHLELNTRLVFEFPESFLDAFLALLSLCQSRVNMEIFRTPLSSHRTASCVVSTKSSMTT